MNEVTRLLVDAASDAMKNSCDAAMQGDEEKTRFFGELELDYRCTLAVLLKLKKRAEHAK